jgi:5-hydroxyisourate hydrolase
VTRVTTHVLDTATGVPASGVPVTLLGCEEDGNWRSLGSGDTDQDGRLTTLPNVQNGLHRLRFVTGSTFFPEVTVTFRVDGEEHLHVPLLLSPFGYTTYRGS